MTFKISAASRLRATEMNLDLWHDAYRTMAPELRNTEKMNDATLADHLTSYASGDPRFKKTYDSAQDADADALAYLKHHKPFTIDWK